MRIRLSTALLTASTALMTMLAAYWCGRAHWYSEDEIEGWRVRARLDLMDAESDNSADAFPVARSLVCRAEAPEDPRRPYYWHSYVAPAANGDPFRPVAESSGWAVSRDRALWECEDAVHETIMNLALYGDSLDELDEEDLDDDLDDEAPEYESPDF